MIDRDSDDYGADELRWAALMCSAQAGHEAAYRLLLEELSEVINRYLCSRFGHHHFIEDSVQDTLVAIHQARHTYDQRRRFRPWLFAIVRHKAIDTLRRQKAIRTCLTVNVRNSRYTLKQQPRVVWRTMPLRDCCWTHCRRSSVRRSP